MAFAYRGVRTCHDVTGWRRDRESRTLTAASMFRLADSVDATDPLPDSRNITATSFSHRSADISVTLDKVADPSPELLATLALEFKAEDVITELTDGNVRFFGIAAGV
ncbi:MAG: hypothetical protein LBE64_10230 [Acinetobacter pittii]|nr:hypothetical protein [Acinetobacter pittii]